MITVTGVNDVDGLKYRSLSKTFYSKGEISKARSSLLYNSMWH
jgi:hypothetical protein